MSHKTLKQKTEHLYPVIISGAFRLDNIMQKYPLTLEADKQIATLLNELHEYFHRASTGDIKSVKELIKEGLSLLNKVIKLLKHDAIADQTEDYESAAVLEDEFRHGLDYIELRNELMTFKEEYLLKIKAIKP